ncbi:protein of unknown function CP12 [Macleaya cordata]|uniref:CP12 domain-containing protein n=1 Tax=Macleaya cordata TaxID=56857 RepID=A0A200R215_MACCD|nr:protein of unknown function CP12 [Macleaya cordata]
MAATLAAGVSFSTTTVVVKASGSTKTHMSPPCLNHPWSRPVVNQFRSGRMYVRTMATPDISNQVSESIKNAEEVCAGDPVSGECVAAWDEVEEVSAAASDARLKKKESDPLENYCKDNPETDECRTYDN